MANADIIFRNASLVDGTGAAAQPADVAVKGDRIAAIAPTLNMNASQEIDVGGHVLAPGFIDAHTHDDRIVLADPDMACKISQGVTTVVTGNCGISIAPVALDKRPPAPLDLIGQEPHDFFGSFADYFNAFDAKPAAINVVAQVGHSSLRVMAMGAMSEELDRPATASEIETMSAALRQALEEGAAGLSTGLAYQPARQAPTEEIEALARVVSEFHGFHSTHMRDEGAGVMNSLAETFRIGRTAEVPIIISHHKCSGIPNHGRSETTLPLIEAARAEQPVALDCYPYAASSTILDPARVKEAAKTIVAWSRALPRYAGRELTDIAADMGVGIEEATAALQPAGAIYFNMHEDDVRRILSFPATMIGSDGLPHDEFPHPRLWGTFPRVIGHYGRDVGLFSLEEAVRKMTSLTAQSFGIKDRGVVAESAFADLVVFDPNTILDRATFAEPTEHASGIGHVFVNGQSVWRDGASVGARPGRGLRRQSLTPLSFAQSA